MFYIKIPKTHDIKKYTNNVMVNKINYNIINFIKNISSKSCKKPMS